MPPFNKMTIMPLSHAYWGMQGPIQLSTDLMVESIEPFLQPRSFELWRDYISKKDRDDLSSTKLGVVHRFFSEEHVGKPEAESQDKIYKLFLLLRLIKPTRARFSNFQLKLIPNSEPDLFSFAHPDPSVPNTPNLQTFNMIDGDDLKEAADLLIRFQIFANSAPWSLTRAVRFYEAGYSQIGDPLLQFISWTTAIESVFSNDKAPVSDSVLAHKIDEHVGGETDIYSEVESEHLADKPEPTLIKDLLPDILLARNLVVHGVRVPIEFDNRMTASPATGEQVHYFDVLREGTSFILRKLILQVIQNTNA